MDIKTLEYLEQRVEKSKEIQRSIDRLNICIQRISNATEVEFKNYKMRETTLLLTNAGDFYENAIKAMTETFKEAAEKEIARLEQEFAEL